ncbi:retrovirus-related pol polyprotein from transposon TNT 1-94 [Tanacetum coccineum]
MNWNNQQSQGFVHMGNCIPNHLIGDCPKPSRNKDQKAFIGGSWSDSENDAEDKTNDETCRMAQSSNECQVLFMKESSEIIKDGKTIRNGIRKNGLYVMKLGNKSQDKLCLATVVDNSTLWHRRLGHANMRLIQSLSSKELVRNLPKLKYDKHFCDACKIGKQAHASHKAKNMVSTKRCLELLHMDLFGPSAIKSYGGNLYTLVVVDDYSRYTWTRFLKTKNEAFEKFEILSRKIQNQLGSSIIAIRTDHGREFDNEVQFGAYCDAQGITHNFSAPRTPQSNGVVERKNRTLQEMSRTMLNEQSIPQKFWCNAVDTSTYILNRILIRPILGKTPYEIFRDNLPPNIKDWELIVLENVICVDAHNSSIDACSAIMLHHLENSQHFNLTYFIAHKIESIKNKVNCPPPYGLLITRLYRFILARHPKLFRPHHTLQFVLHYRMMSSINRKNERKRNKSEEAKLDIPLLTSYAVESSNQSSPLLGYQSSMDHF